MGSLTSCASFTEIHIANGVWEELNAGGMRWPGRDDVAAADWIQRHAVQNQTLVTALRGDLDRGESESIALALELGADLRQTAGFYLSDSLYQHALELANESSL